MCAHSVHVHASSKRDIENLVGDKLPPRKEKNHAKNTPHEDKSLWKQALWMTKQRLQHPQDLVYQQLYYLRKLKTIRSALIKRNNSQKKSCAQIPEKY